MILPLVRANYLPYAQARLWLRQADLLLWHYTGGSFGRMIRRRAPPTTPYVHVGMAILPGYSGGPIHSVDIQFRRGGQRRRLSKDVEENPGKIEVWRLSPPLLPTLANSVALAMEEVIDKPYGWTTCLAYGLRTAWWWPFMNPLPDDKLTRATKPICSQAVGYACWKGAGRDPLPNGEAVTLPWHFAENRFAEYQFTLIP